MEMMQVKNAGVLLWICELKKKLEKFFNIFNNCSQRFYPGIPFVIGFYHNPRGIRGICSCKHLINRTIVLIPFLPVTPVLFSDLVLLERVIFPLFEPFELFVLVNLKPEL